MQQNRKHATTRQNDTTAEIITKVKVKDKYLKQQKGVLMLYVEYIRKIKVLVTMHGSKTGFRFDCERRRTVNSLFSKDQNSKRDSKGPVAQGHDGKIV